MRQDCWQLWPDRGLLINPDPISDLLPHLESDFPVPAAAIDEIQSIAARLSTLLETRLVRKTLDALPVYDFSPLADYRPASGFIVVERLQQMFAYFASAYVYATHETPAKRIPAGVAVPLYQLSRIVRRPPILAYCNYVLNNWRKIDPEGPIAVDNLRLIQTFLGNPDESWFILIHVDIEARAAGALLGMRDAVDAARGDDAARVEAGLEAVANGLDAMMRTFARMPEGCNPDDYYFKVRPYLFGFDDVIYEGVDAFGGQPQTVRGQTGAQSSIIPALRAGLGIVHEANALMHYLDVMKDNMPQPHREFVAQMERSTLRDYVTRPGQSPALVEVYNHCLHKLMGFRKLHYHFATEYIFKKVDNPVGTGGTMFMDWLHRLIGETERHLVT